MNRHLRTCIALPGTPILIQVCFSTPTGTIFHNKTIDIVGECSSGKSRTVPKDMRYILFPRSTTRTNSSVDYLFRSQIN
ncbi:hypothetical protein V6Z11_A02G088500 [Gossypium hirsutum]